MAADETSSPLPFLRPLWRLRLAAAEDATLIGFLVSMSIHAAFENLLYEALARRRLSDTELSVVQFELNQIALRDEVLRAMRGELAWLSSAFDWLADDPDRIPVLIGVNRSELGILRASLAACGPLGWLKQNHARAMTWRLDEFPSRRLDSD